MSSSLYITSAQAHAGKTAVALGVMDMLTRNVAHIGLFRPIILNADGSDAMLDLLRNRYDIDQRPEDTYCMTIAEAATYFESGQPEKVIERAVDAFAALKSKYEFMVVIGTDYLGPAAGTELELNAELAANLGAPPRTVFRTVMLPLTLPGILTGCVFVFVPSLGNFVVPELLGGGKPVGYLRPSPQLTSLLGAC